MLLVISLIFPSLELLFNLELSPLEFDPQKPETFPEMTLKVKGHQWFWRYRADYRKLRKELPRVNFDSSMMKCSDLSIQGGNVFRHLEVKKPMILPCRAKIKVLATSEDVIHSFTIPDLLVKMDAIPGRINKTDFYTQQPGRYRGSCSEICGMNHGFMPIQIWIVFCEHFFRDLYRGPKMKFIYTKPLELLILERRGLFFFLADMAYFRL